MGGAGTAWRGRGLITRHCHPVERLSGRSVPFPEAAMKDAIIAFARAVGWGTLAGAAPFMGLVAIPIAFILLIAGENICDIAILLAYPMTVSGALVIGSALVFGLPLTFLLSECEREDGGTYAMTGLFLGALVPVMVVVAAGGPVGGEILFLSLPGAFAGLVTGISWGWWRERRQAAQARIEGR
jgi:hypothetical protein